MTSTRAAARCSPLLLALLLPGALGGQETEEQRYAPTKVLDCDYVFAVVASVSGEPHSVLRCPRAEGRDLFFAPGRILDLTHIDSVVVAPADSGFRQVVVQLTEEGVRRMRRSASIGELGEIGVVLDGEVVARFVARVPDGSFRLTVLARVSPERAKRVADRLRAEIARRSDRSGGRCSGSADP